MLFFLAATLHTTIKKSTEENALCAQILTQHRVWHTKVKKDTEALRSTSKRFTRADNERAKELLKKEIVAIKTIQGRLSAKWSDCFGDFFGKQTTIRRFQLFTKFKRLDEFLTYALNHFEELQEKYSSLPKTAYSGIYPEDPMVTQEAFCYRLTLIFQRLANGETLNFESESYLGRYDTLEFDCSGSIFSREKAFLLPHQGYILSGQRLTQKYRFGAEDCTSIINRYYPEIPEMGFSTLTLWAWVNNDWKDLKDYQYMERVFDKTLCKVNHLEPGVFILIKGHIWTVLGKEGDKVHVISYRRLDWELQKVGFLIETIDWPMPPETAYAILKPLY